MFLLLVLILVGLGVIMDKLRAINETLEELIKVMRKK